MKELSRRVCWADVGLGVFLCSRYLSLFSSLTTVVQGSIRSFCPNLSPKVRYPMGQLCMLTRGVLCLEWDTHFWTVGDLLKCAEWGNYSAQRYTLFGDRLTSRYWASSYFSKGNNKDKFWKLSSDGYWCPRIAA